MTPSRCVSNDWGKVVVAASAAWEEGRAAISNLPSGPLGQWRSRFLLEQVQHIPGKQGNGSTELRLDVSQTGAWSEEKEAVLGGTHCACESYLLTTGGLGADAGLGGRLETTRGRAGVWEPGIYIREGSKAQTGMRHQAGGSRETHEGTTTTSGCSDPPWTR